ncbi:MAG TPA: hypothetical protein HPP95_10470 [Deltaproteobacteria bacterium]|nr:hypothetical protein [Deltaproteobacteria bacterium]
MPTLDACILDPTAPGCTTVLPTLDACTTTPTLPGCTVVLPTLDACILDPTAPGCTTVLPTLDACTTTPTEPGCTAVLPTFNTCTTNPTLPGCTAVLPLALIETPPVELAATILAVVTLEPVPLMQPTVTPTIPATTPSGQQDASGNIDKEKESMAEEIPITTASQGLPLSKQPIFDLSGGGIAGQNMVCK